jgi:anti-sigma regulatory factor (Ser/Thr protein kinase)
MSWTSERIAALHERVSRARRDAVALRSGERGGTHWLLSDNPEGLEQSYPAEPETVPLVRRAVAEMARKAGATDEQLDGIRLAVSEAVSNAVLYAYAGTTGEVHVTATVIGPEMTVLVADDGCGPRVPAREPGLGWGWKLIAQTSDMFTIAQRSTGGTETRIRFRIGTDAAATTADQSRGSDASATRPASPRFSTTT